MTALRLSPTSGTPLYVKLVERLKHSIDTGAIKAGEQLPSGEFTTRYARMVEEQIRAAPADWPWSHKRWKLKKPLY